MIPLYRQFIPKLFAIVALILIPTTLFLSSGNTIFNNGAFSKTMSLKVNTLPAFSNIKIGNTDVGSLNTDIKISDGVNINLNITNKGYKDENWKVYSPKDQNSNLSFDPMFLLPNEGLSINSEYKITNIIDSNLALGTKDDKNYFIPYDFAGLKTGIEIKQPIQDLSTKPIKLDDRSYFFDSSKLMLHNYKEKLSIVSFDNLPFKIKKLIKVTDNILLILNAENKLYTYNIDTLEYKFLVENAYDIQPIQNSNSGFLLTNLGIFRLDRGFVPTSDNFVSSKANFLLPAEGVIKELYNTAFKPVFKLTQIQNGVVLLINNNLFINQEGIKDWKLIERNVSNHFIMDNKIMYLDKDFNLKLLDIYEQFIYYVTTFDPDKSDYTYLYYSQDWSRIMFYSNNKIQSTFFNKNFLPYLPTSPVISSKPITWLDSQYCYHEVVEKSQFCISNGVLKQYRNVNFVPLF
jgi:hypothetical protein